MDSQTISTFTLLSPHKIHTLYDKIYKSLTFLSTQYHVKPENQPSKINLARPSKSDLGFSQPQRQPSLSRKGKKVRCIYTHTRAAALHSAFIRCPGAAAAEKLNLYTRTCARELAACVQKYGRGECNARALSLVAHISVLRIPARWLVDPLDTL